jgi:hypothetical protein
MVELMMVLRIMILIMPRLAAFRRVKQSLTIASPEDRVPTEAPSIFAAISRSLESAPMPAFLVGDYQVGEVFCPHLCGHPGIRY